MKIKLPLYKPTDIVYFVGNKCIIGTTIERVMVRSDGNNQYVLTGYMDYFEEDKLYMSLIDPKLQEIIKL